MDICFVIQPFDNDKFDLRFEDVYSPAIRNAGLEPYRVDKDAAVSDLVEAIEINIKKARVCLAEISLDNPNVWFELGYAFALSKPIVMISEGRLKFPFDIQHLAIITYKTGSVADFTKLQHAITEKIKALLEKESGMQNILETPVKPRNGLLDHESAMIFLIMQNRQNGEIGATAWQLGKDMSNAGFNTQATNLSLLSLQAKDLITESKERNGNGEKLIVYRLTHKGTSWILDNQHLLPAKKAHATSNT